MNFLKRLIMLIVMLIFVSPVAILAQTVCTYTANVAGVEGNTFSKYYLYIDDYFDSITKTRIPLFKIGYEMMEVSASATNIYSDTGATVTFQGKKMTVKNVGPLLEAKGAPKAYTLSNLELPIQKCPKFVWIGADYFETTIGVALYDEILTDVTNHQAVCNSSGGTCYTNVFLKKINEETSMSNKNDYNEKLQQFKDLIAELDELVDDTGHAIDCGEFNNRYPTIYKELASLETALTNFAKYDSSLTFDKDYGSDIRALGRSADSYCYLSDPDGDDGGGNNSGSYNEGTQVSKCEVIPEAIRKWINNILKFVRYVALALVVALGALDFMKAAGSGEADAMKKAGQSFMKRMIAVAILFLLPVIVDLILNMVNIYGIPKDNIDCL